MATQAEIDGLASKLITSGRLSWVVADCPVVALYKNKMTREFESLGQPLDRNGYGDILRLWIGSNQDTREIFVTLTIRIRASPVRKKTRRQGRLMFLIVPAESLRLHSACVGYSSLEKLPPNLLDMPNDVESAKSQLLHVSLDLGSMTSDVIMPEYQCRPNVMPQAMMLLRKLKLLSEASFFHLYANQDAAIQTALQNVSSMLAGNESVTTPSVVTTGFYPGGRSACKNLWVDQGWLEDTDHNDQNKKDAAGTKRKEIIKSFDPQPPPPYEPDTVLPPKFTSSGQNKEPYLPSTACFAPENGATCLPQTAPFSPHLLHAGNLATESPTNQLAHPIAGAHPSAASNHIFAPLPRLHPSTPEPSLSPDYSATFLSGFPSTSPLRRINDVSEDPREAVTRDGSCLSVQVAASICDRAFSDNNTSTRANTPSEIERIPDSLIKKRAPSYSHEEGPASTAKRLATAEATRRPLLLNGPNAELSPTVADTISYHDGQATRESANTDMSIAGDNQLSRWLTLAWNHCPTAHYLFITELLEFGAAVANNQPEDIANCHINCTLTLLARCTTEALAAKRNMDTVVKSPCKVGDETKTLLHWLYTLRPGADMESFSSLLKLSIAEQQFLHTLTEAEHATLVASCKKHRANIVSQACTTFGQEMLQNDGVQEVSTKMLREQANLRSYSGQIVII